jgi:protein-tyrosine phosphatase
MIEPFAIIEIDAPGGARVAVSRMPGRSGALAADVAAITAWGARVVLSMTPSAEMQAKGAGGLPDALAQRGVSWLHVPVADYSAPDPAVCDWPTVAAALHGALDAGGRVLIHCAGGKGRSGMAAARLLAERGFEAGMAIAAVRAARPGAIETSAQEAWIAEASERRLGGA